MKTCAECGYAAVERVGAAGIAFCTRTKSLVPQIFDQAVDPENVYTIRIPVWCPLVGVGGRAPSTDALPEKEWQPIPLTKV